MSVSFVEIFNLIVNVQEFENVKSLVAKRKPTGWLFVLIFIVFKILAEVFCEVLIIAGGFFDVLNACVKIKNVWIKHQGLEPGFAHDGVLRKYPPGHNTLYGCL